MMKLCNLNLLKAKRNQRSFTWDLEPFLEYGRNRYTQICLVSLVLNFELENNLVIKCSIIDKSPCNESSIMFVLPAKQTMSHRSTIEGNIYQDISGHRSVYYIL